MKARSPIPWRTLLASSIKLAVIAQAQDSTSLENQVQVKRLNKGMALLVFEDHVSKRHDTPVFSGSTHMDPGTDRHVSGLGGLDHMQQR